MTNNIALKPYLDEVNGICDDLSFKELVNFVLELAKEVPSQKRKDFLCNLKSYITPDISNVEDKRSEIIKEIDSLKEEIAERQRSIDDGSYYDDIDYSDYGYDPCDEEAPDPLSEDQKYELKEFIKQADKLFLADKLEEAKCIYESLISFFDFDDSKYDEIPNLSITDVDINWKETLARYCRCGYETSQPDKLVHNMIEALKINLSQFDTNYNVENEVYPFLQDIYDAKVSEPIEWSIFLNNLKEELRGKTNNRAFVLFLESVDKTDGLDKVQTEVQKYKISVGYLYLLNKLVKKEYWEKVSIIAQEAIDNISNSLRLDASNILVLVAEKLQSNELILKGKREVFFSDPDNFTLLLFVEEAKKQNVKNIELNKAVEYLKGKNTFYNIKIKVLLMLGELNEAISVIEGGKNIGWTYKEEMGLSFSALLIALTKADPKAKTQQTLLKRYIGSRYSYSLNKKEMDIEKSICQEILDGLKNISFDNSTKDSLTEIIETTGRSRIDIIVSNKQRHDYDRAAEILGAITEYFMLDNNQQKAYSFVREFINNKYSAYRAFKKEVANVFKGSTLLNHIK